jgi:FSR family fosmidomycin resistance protein-like MFS transporter
MQEKHQILLTVSLFHALDDGAISVIPLLFPIFKDLFALSYTQIGILTGGGLLITLLTQLVIGRIADKRNFRTLLSTGILVLGVSMLFVSQSTDFLTLLLFIFLLRFGAGFFHPVGVGWISKVFKRDKVDGAMGIQSGFGDLGAFLAVLTTLYIAEYTGWRYPLYLWAIVCVAGLLIGMYLTHRIPFTILAKKKFNHVESAKELYADAVSFMKRMKLLLPAFIVSGASWGIIITFLPLFLVAKQPDLSLASIGLIIALWIGLGSIISFLYGRIQRVLGRRTLLLFAYTTLGISGVLLAFFSNIYIILGVVVLIGISVFLTYPTLFSCVSQGTHETAEGKTFGFVFTFQLGGGTFLLFISGVCADIWGIWTPFLLIGSLSLLVALILVITSTKQIISYFTPE